MTEDWTDEARRRLLDLRRGAGAWAYHARSSPAVEPSALAALALLADGERAPESLAAARWLASIRRPDGSTGVTVALPEPGWPTPFAVLVWYAVGGFDAERSAAVDWLLKQEGRTYRRVENGPLGHDTSIVGWPWVAGTHSWVEPTSLALLALAREGHGDHPRAAEGARMLVDRAIPGGGWNLGNPVVFGTPLRPLPGPSGLALLALAAVRGTPSPQPSPTRGEGVRKAPSPLVGEGWGEGTSDLACPSTLIAPAIAYLRTALAETLAPISLGWGLLGLRAWGTEPSESRRWLASAFDQIASREPRADELALLLLAAGPRSPGILGITDEAEDSRHA